MYTGQTANPLKLSPCLAPGPADWASVGKRGDLSLTHSSTPSSRPQAGLAGAHTCWAWLELTPAGPGCSKPEPRLRTESNLGARQSLHIPL